MSNSNRGSTTRRNELRRLCFQTFGTNCMNCGERATEVDHIIELAAGGDNELSNLQPLCKPCHKAKTAQFNSKRKKINKNRVFSGQVAPPTLFLASLSPLRRIDPPGGES